MGDRARPHRRGRDAQPRTLRPGKGWKRSAAWKCRQIGRGICRSRFPPGCFTRTTTARGFGAWARSPGRCPG